MSQALGVPTNQRCSPILQGALSLTGEIDEQLSKFNSVIGAGKGYICSRDQGRLPLPSLPEASLPQRKSELSSPLRNLWVSIGGRPGEGTPSSGATYVKAQP